MSDDALERARQLEAERIEAVARVVPAVVSIFDNDQSGGGSGVIVDEAGYGLTNYHVVAGMMKTRRGKGGLGDGKLYPLEVLGIDITGDVAMFRLTGRDSFAYAPLGDSDDVRQGDAVIAMGNPFSLSEDYSPTVTTGIVTGIHRYQGEGETLVYTDAIQTDAAINPGNSGGPLFDAQGRVIGINGRISAEMHKYARGRYNVGLGYAITINQIKRFMPALRAGLLAKHGTMLATVMDDVDAVIFNDMYEDAPAWDAGVRVGNRLLRFGDVEIRSANQFLSILGTYPQDWPVPITFDSFGRVVHKVVRLEGVTPPMRREYVVDAETNRRATERTIGAFREAVLGSGRSDGPRVWTWTAVRLDEAEGDRGGSTKEARRHEGTEGLRGGGTEGLRDEGAGVRFRIVDARGRKAERVELDAEGERVRRIESDAVEAFWTERGERYTVDAEETLYYAAMYALRWKLLDGGEVWHEEGVGHVGSDALAVIDESGRLVGERKLEAVQIPLSEHVTLRVGFELETHLPARLLIVDVPTGDEVEVELSGYGDMDGLTWPGQLSIRSAKLRFQETVSDLKVEW